MGLQNDYNPLKIRSNKPWIIKSSHNFDALYPTKGMDPPIYVAHLRFLSFFLQPLKILFWKINLIILWVLYSCGTWHKRSKVATEQNGSNEPCLLLKISTFISKEGCLVMEKVFCWPHLFSSVFVQPNSFSGFLQDFLPQFSWN